MAGPLGLNDLSSQSSLTPGFRAAGPNATSASTTTITVSRPIGACHHLLAVLVYSNSAGAPPTQSSGWELQSTAHNGGVGMAIYSRAALPASEPASYSWTTTTASFVGVILDYTGHALTAYQNIAFADVNPQQAPSILAPGPGVVIEVFGQPFATSNGTLSLSANVNRPTTRVPSFTSSNLGFFIVDYPITATALQTGDTGTSNSTLAQTAAWAGSVI